jgi:hypothetical protein
MTTGHASTEMGSRMGEDPLIEWIAATIDCGNVGVVAEFWRQLLGLVWLEDPLPG